MRGPGDTSALLVLFSRRGLLCALVAVFLCAGCTFGMSAPVQRSVESPQDSFEQAYTNAWRAMHEVGRVTSADRRAGYVHGTSHAGVDLEVTLERLPADGVKVNIKAAMTAGKIAYGTSTPDIAADKFVEVYKKHAK